MPIDDGAVRPFTVLFLSNMLREKGVADFIDIAGKVSSEHTDSQFVVAGAESAEYTVAIVEELALTAELGPSTRVLGPIGQDDKWRLLAQADLLIFPSKYKYEAQPLTILESLASGTPVVAYAIGGIVDVLGNQDGSHIVPIGDTRAAADFAISLAKDPLRRMSASNSARFRYKKTYSFATYSARWDQALRESLASD
ncbi:hypothetical protein GCM10010988_13030 [Cnuibacter physcomitrellae]|uniref:glycosyltransferase family 4 protein n=1 Tax=Cnuibacter physcomitrellae TaxID=1619308 RepID=UPI00157C2BA5|nr:glycosyltransferase [Cnuibacter physcomitrellae]GGI37254.1 hypothetical protein GCM10010988_13030 [Cnuibacter physcomitrellae]